MAKETIVKSENPVTDALRKLKEEEAELTAKLKPLQEAISALEKILDKSSKKAPKAAKETSAAAEIFTEEAAQEEEPAETAE
jgi:prefoldin subunit 5